VKMSRKMEAREGHVCGLFCMPDIKHFRSQRMGIGFDGNGFQ